jgi:hypothetical protein
MIDQPCVFEASEAARAGEKKPPYIFKIVREYGVPYLQLRGRFDLEIGSFRPQIYQQGT